MGCFFPPPNTISVFILLPIIDKTVSVQYEHTFTIYQELIQEMYSIFEAVFEVVNCSRVEVPHIILRALFKIEYDRLSTVSVQRYIGHAAAVMNNKYSTVYSFHRD